MTTLPFQRSRTRRYPTDREKAEGSRARTTLTLALAKNQELLRRLREACGQQRPEDEN